MDLRRDETKNASIRAGFKVFCHKTAIETLQEQGIFRGIAVIVTATPLLRKSKPFIELRAAQFDSRTSNSTEVAPADVGLESATLASLLGADAAPPLLGRNHHIFDLPIAHGAYVQLEIRECAAGCSRSPQPGRFVAGASAAKRASYSRSAQWAAVSVCCSSARMEGTSSESRGTNQHEFNASESRRSPHPSVGYSSHRW